MKHPKLALPLKWVLCKPQDYIADHGKGSYIWTTDGQKHLDMGAGVYTSYFLGRLSLPHTVGKSG